MEFIVVAAVIAAVFLLLKNIKNRRSGSGSYLNYSSDASTWEKGFITFYMLDKLQHEREFQGAINFLSSLSRKEISFSDNQTLLVLLRSYLHKTGEQTLTPEIYEKVVNLLPGAIKWELAAFDSKASLRSYLSSMTEEGVEKESLEDLNKRTEEFLAEIGGNNEYLEAVKLELIKFRLNNSFTKYHSTSFQDFSRNIIDDYVDSRGPGEATL